MRLQIIFRFTYWGQCHHWAFASKGFGDVEPEGKMIARRADQRVYRENPAFVMPGVISQDFSELKTQPLGFFSALAMPPTLTIYATTVTMRRTVTIWPISLLR